MRVLIFDTETTGLPKNYKAPLSEWPHIVQLSYLIYDLDNKKIVTIQDHIVKLPEGITISEDSIKVHGITNEIAQEKGIDIKEALLRLSICLDDVQMIVAHNLSFDKNMVQAACLRADYVNILKTKPFIEYCTMRHSIDLCNIEVISTRTNKPVKKWPKLIELYEFLFKEIPNHLHDSLIDVLVCLRCFYKMTTGKDIVQIDNNYKEILYKHTL